MDVLCSNWPWNTSIWYVLYLFIVNCMVGALVRVLCPVPDFDWIKYRRQKQKDNLLELGTLEEKKSSWT